MGIDLGTTNSVVAVMERGQPRVIPRLEELFGRKADRSMNADEAVTLGAAIQAGCLSGDLKDILLLDTTSLSLAIEIAGGVAKVLIPRNTTIPTRKTELISMPTADHTTVSLHVIQGERPAAKDNTTIGRFQLIDLPPVPPGVRLIEVTFDIDPNAVIHVTAKDAVFGLRETFRIGMPSAFGGDPSPRLMDRLEDIADRNKKARGMYGGTRDRSWSVSSKIERFQCKKCGFASNVQIVGEGRARRNLKEVEPALARGTGWPGAGVGRRRLAGAELGRPRTVGIDDTRWNAVMDAADLRLPRCP